MKQNIKCTIEDIINSLKEKYRTEGENTYMQTVIGMFTWQMMNCF